MLDTSIIHADFAETKLQGGTLGDVRLLEGMAETAGGDKLPYKLLLKTQKKWERPGDADSWQREYDLCASNLDEAMSDSFCRPKCYYAEKNDDEIQIWMEYAQGVSGEGLNINMLERAAYELGCFQSKLVSRPKSLRNISNFSDTGFLKRDYEQWHTQLYSYERLIAERCPLPDAIKQVIKEYKIQMIEGKSFEYSFLRSNVCDIPSHLKQMIIDIDDNMDSIFDKISHLPIVLCHRDFWNENIICNSNDNKIWLIDWDTTGWGYLGEDLASLIADEIDFDNFEEYCIKMIPAYYKGISEHMDISAIDKNFVYEMILIKFGYRMARNYIFEDDDDEKSDQIQALQKIYEMI